MLRFEAPKLKEDQALVRISVAAITGYWKKYNWYQRSQSVASYAHDYPWDVEPLRMESLFAAASGSIEVPPIKLHLSTGKRKGVCFPDGRHRICVASILGNVIIPAIVKKSEKKDIEMFLN